MICEICDIDFLEKTKAEIFCRDCMTKFNEKKKCYLCNSYFGDIQRLNCTMHGHHYHLECIESLISIKEFDEFFCFQCDTKYIITNVNQMAIWMKCL